MFGHRVFLRIGELSDSSLGGLYKEGYELLNCDYSFSQGVDQKGQAQTAVRGGTIHLALPTLPSDEIVSWALSFRKYNNGVLVICDADNVALEKVYFKEAACVNMEISYAQEGSGYIATTLTLQAKEIQVGTVKLENRWTI